MRNSKRIWRLPALTALSTLACIAATPTTYSTNNPYGKPYFLAKGGDGNVWFTDASGYIGKVVVSGPSTGTVTEYPLPNNEQSFAYPITADPSGNLWVGAPNAVVEVFVNGQSQPYSTPYGQSSHGFSAITRGPDGNIWFADTGTNSIGAISTGGQFLGEFPVPTANAAVSSITVGPDGKLWFTESNTGKIGTLPAQTSPAPTITEFSGLLNDASPASIVTGPDGALWFTDVSNSCVGRTSTSGTVTEYGVPSGFPVGITTGPDGQLWYTGYTSSSVGYIGRITTDGFFTSYAISSGNSLPEGIIVGPDQTLWFADLQGNDIGKLPVPLAFDNPAAPPLARLNLSYGYTYFALGGIAPYTWSASGLPSGMSINPATGQITGAPTVSGSSDVTITVTDSSSPKQSQSYPTSITVSANNVFQYTLYPTNVPNVLTSNIVAGVNNDLWYIDHVQSDPSSGYIEKITTSGVTTSYVIPGSSGTGLGNLVVADGLLWFTDYENGACTFGSIDESGNVQVYPTPCSSTIAPTGFAYSPTLDQMFAATLPSSSGLWNAETLYASGPYTGQEVTNHQLGNIQPVTLATGSDQAIWFPLNNQAFISRIDARAGGVTTYPVQYSDGGSAIAAGIVAGPDRAMWFSDTGGSMGRITSNGIATDIQNGGCNGPYMATSATDGAIWTASGCGVLTRMTTDGTQNTYGLAPGSASGMTSGPDGNMWFNVTYNPAKVTWVTQLSSSCSNLPQSAQAGTPVNGGTCSSSGGVGPYIYLLGSGGGLPPGMGINPTTGGLTGTPTQAGTFNYSIQAADSGTPPQTYLSPQGGSYVINVTAGPPSNITAQSGTPQSAGTNTNFKAPLIAYVTDANKNPVSGAVVTFAAPGSGASATFNGSASVQAETDSSGLATSPTVTANGITGTYVVTATLQVGGAATSFTLTNIKATSVTISAPTTPVTYGAPISISATVSPSTVSGKVSFYDGANLIGESKLNNGAGQLATSLLSPGSHNLFARYDGDSSNASSVSASHAVQVSPVAGYTFRSGANYTVDANSSGSRLTAVGDFNNDGKPDLAVTDAGSGTVTILVNNGSGTFTPTSASPISLGGTGAPGRIAVFDLNGDGNADLVTVNQQSGTYNVLLGNGDGTFLPAQVYAVEISEGGVNVSSLAVGDVNNDGLPDLVISGNLGEGGGVVCILPGNGDGTFQSPGAVQVGASPQAIELADFNNDGKLDIVTVDPSSGDTGSIYVLLGNGDGTFQSPTTFTAGTSPSGIGIGDFNGDGNLDLAIANNGVDGPGGANVFLGNGAGSFSDTGNPVSAGNEAGPIAVSDFDGDGNLDLAIANTADGTITLAYGDGNGNFNVHANNTLTVTSAGNNSPRAAVVVADFNLDGRPDVAASYAPFEGGGDVVFLAIGPPATLTPTGGAAQSTTINTQFPNPLIVNAQDSSGNNVPRYPITFSVPDTLGARATLSSFQVNTDGNGNASVTATANGYDGSYQISAGAASTTNQAIFNLTNTGSGTAANLAYVAGSGQSTQINTQFPTALQVMVADGSNNPVSGATVNFSVQTSGNAGAQLSGSMATTGSNGIANITATANGTVGTYTVMATSAGLSGSPVSFTLTNNGLNAATVALGLSQSTIQLGQPVTLTATVTPSAATGLVSFYDGGTLLGEGKLPAGNSGIVVFATALLGPGKHSLTARYDGDTNYGAAKSSAQALTVTANTTVNFRTGSTYGAGNSSGNEFSVIADFNNDHKPDIAVTSFLSNTVTMLTGNGDGTFSPTAASPMSLGQSKNPSGIIAIDLDGDGNMDIITLNAGDFTYSVLLGNGNGTFQSPQSYSVSTSPYFVAGGIAVGDVNGDGIPDLVFTGQNLGSNAGTLVVLPGKGDGTFNAELDGPSFGKQPASLVLADFNKDGNLDIAALDLTTALVYVLDGNGDGTFQAPTATLTPQAGPYAIATADFDNDGNSDIAVSNSGGDSISTFLGDGTGAFTAKTSPVNVSPFAIFVTDLNSDGIPDLVVSNGTSASVILLIGNGDGTFTSSASYSLGLTGTPTSLVVEDFNGDGLPDVGVSLPQSSGATETILLGVGSPSSYVASGTPQSAVVANPFSQLLQVTVTDAGNNPVPGVLVSFTAPQSGASASLSASHATTDNNGVASITATANTVAGSYTVTATVGSLPTPAPFSLTNVPGPPASISAVAGSGQSAPLNTQFANQLQALVLDAYANPAPGYSVNFIAPGSGASASVSSNSAVTGPNGIASVTAVANNISGTYTVNASPAGFALSAPFTLSNSASSAFTLSASSLAPKFGANVQLTATVTSNANATGKISFYDGADLLDTMSVSQGAATYSSILLASGKHTITAKYSGDASDSAATSNAQTVTVSAAPETTLYNATAPALGAGNGPFQIVVGDFNHDGIADFAVAEGNLPKNNVQVFIGTGNGTFNAPVTYSVPSAFAIGAADVNGDGNIDLVTLSVDTLTVLPGAADGTFGSPITSNIGQSTTGVNAIGFGDFNSDGNLDLAIATNDVTGTLLVAFGNGDGTFGSAAVYKAGKNASWLQVGDLNGDGYPDIVTSDNVNQNINVLLNNGQGVFATAVPYSTGTSAQRIVVADFRGIGKLDVAAANEGGSSIAVLLGNGDGTFQSAVGYPLSVNSSLSLVAADVDGDGIPDLAVANNSTVAVLTGTGTGTFNNPVNYPQGNVVLYDIVAADFNGDGRTDLALPLVSFGSSTPAQVAILLGAGPAASATTTGTPQSATVNTAFASALQVTVTDSNNHPLPGVSVSFSAPSSGASAQLSANQVTTDNKGNASVTATANATAGSYTVTATVAGLSSQPAFSLTNLPVPPGNIQVIAGSGQTAAVNTAFATALQVKVTDAGNNPLPNVQVSFSAPVSGPSATLSSPTAITNALGVAGITATANAIAGTYTVTASVAGIGTPATFTLTDKAVSSVNLSVSSTATRFGMNVQLTAVVTPVTATGLVGFYDGTQLIDSKILTAGSATISTILLGNGKHSVSATYFGDSQDIAMKSPAQTITTSSTPASALLSRASYSLGNLFASEYTAVADFNGDGIADLAVANAGDGTVYILLGKGDGTFTTTAASPYQLPGESINVNGIRAADVNSDGKTDLVLVSGSTVFVLLGNGDGTMQAPTTQQFELDFVFQNFTVGDFNGDGIPDVAISSTENGGAVVLKGTGDGTFTPSTPVIFGEFPGRVEAADMNGDGKLDLVATDIFAGNLYVVLGNGDGTFQPAVPYTTNTPTDLVVADFNGDGNLDVAVANPNNGTVSIFLGSASGTLTAGTPVSVGSGLYSEAVRVLDANGDGVPDLAVAASSESTGETTVTIFIGDGTGNFTGAQSATVSDFVSDLVASDFNRDGRADLVVSTFNLGDPAILLGVGPAAAIAPTTGTPQSTQVATAFATPLTAHVTDSSNNPVPGVAVTYSAPASGASATIASTTSLLTDNNGNVSTTAAANMLAGNYSVTAVANGVPSPANFTLTNMSGPAASIAAAAGSAQSAGINSVFGTALQVLVVDSYGNPVPNILVTFAVPVSGASATLSNSSVATNAAGVASTTATANSQIGSYSVTASAAGLQNPATFVLTNTRNSTNIGLTTSSSPSVLGSRVTLTATITPATATGVVTFYDGATVLGSSTVTGGVASLATIVLPVGSRVLRAYYSGDTNDAPMSSAPITQTVTSTPATTFRSGAAVSVGNSPIVSVLSDFNGDGIADLAVLNKADKTVSILLGKGDGAFTPQVTNVSTAGVAAMVAADFNRDGKTDLAIGTSSGAVLILPGNGDGTFGTAFNVNAQPGITAMAVTDANGDGIPDLLLTGVAEGGYGAVLYGNGDGTFRSPIIFFAASANPAAIEVADLNGDGKPDVVIANQTGNNIGVLLSSATGGFGSVVTYSVGSAPQAIAVGDFNGDGKPDIAVANTGSNLGTVSVLLGNGDGTFQVQVTYPAGGLNPSAIAIGDINGDGKQDLAVTSANGNTLDVLLGNGDGTFQSPATYSAGTSPNSIVLGDFNGDGRTDAAVANASSTVNILLGVGSAMAITTTGGTPQSASVLTAFGTPLSVTVSDSSGNPVPGVQVTFAGPASGASAVLSSTTATTDNTGTASVTATANQHAGSYNVSALVAGVTTPASFVLTNLAGTSAAIVASAGTPQSAKTGTQFAVALQVFVTDAGGNPIAGATVTFTAPVSGASATLSSATAVTNAGGLASVNATANAVIGTYSVSASIPGVANAATFSLTNTAPTVIPLAITTTSVANAVLNTAYSATLTAQGGVPPYTWTITGLPAGLSQVGNTAAISGTPTAGGSTTFSATVRDSGGSSANATIPITVNPAITVTLPTGIQQPGSSVNGQIQSSQPVTSPVSGNLTLTFNENAVGLPNPYVNPGVCFSSSSCANPPQISTNFTIAAGSSSASIPPVQTGTVAGDIVVTLNVAGQAPTTSVLTVPRIAPIIESNSVQILDLTSTGFTVEVVANSTPRDLQTATFTFNAASGAHINGTSTFNLDVSSLLAQWYASSEGQGYGSAFSLQVPFTLAGDPKAIQSVTVTLTNSAGTSAPVTGTP